VNAFLQVIDVWKGGNWQEEMAKVTSAGFHTGEQSKRTDSFFLHFRLG